MNAPPTADIVARYITPLLRFHDCPLDAFLVRGSDGRWGVPSATVLPSVVADPAHDLRARFHAMLLLTHYVRDVAPAVAIVRDRLVVDADRAHTLFAERHASVLVDRADVMAENVVTLADLLEHSGGAAMFVGMILSAHDASRFHGGPFFQRALSAVFAPHT